MTMDDGETTQPATPIPQLEINPPFNPSSIKQSTTSNPSPLPHRRPNPSSPRTKTGTLATKEEKVVTKCVVGFQKFPNRPKLIGSGQVVVFN